jgi:hypothetical protein
MGFGEANVEHAILNHLLGGTTWTAPAAIWVGLANGTVNSTSSGTEPSGGSYARIQFSRTDWDDNPASGAISNKVEKEFAQATADWLSAANLTNAVFFDASTAGNYLGFAPLSTAKAVSNGDTAKFAVGNLTLQFT